MDSSVVMSNITSVRRHRRLLNNHESLIFWIQHIVDLLLVCGCLFFFAFLKFDSIPPGYRVLAVIAVLCVWIVYRRRGVYRQSAGFWGGAFTLLGAWFRVLLLLALFSFLTKSGSDYSRAVLLSWGATAYLLQLLSHSLLGLCYQKFNKLFAREIPVLVIGNGKLAENLIYNLNSNIWLHDHVVGVVVQGDMPLSDLEEMHPSIPVLGRLSGLRSLLKEHGIRRVYLALPVAESEVIEGLHFDLMDMNVDMIWVPDIFGLNLLNHSVREVAGMPLLSLNESPLTSSRSSIVLKNLMDKLLAALALLLLSPLMVVIAIVIKSTSPGPVLFKQQRHGWDGKVISVWKFRSMYMHQDEQVAQATRNDPRVTRVGAFIRKTSIDELPQFFNVLQGRMSLVGPRPHALSHNDYYSDKVSAYLARHRIKPGITGLAQISGYRGETETLDKMAKRVELDLAYINNWSLALDLKILIRTPFSLFSKNIY